mmetsp:Transcript_24002/g.66634  ORF Transcript_24002/g.66634 Transcript_24002/m.66634 type:complete len:93 (+) Transcript_24002:783-1061(+)
MHSEFSIFRTSFFLFLINNNTLIYTLSKSSQHRSRRLSRFVVHDVNFHASITISSASSPAKCGVGSFRLLKHAKHDFVSPPSFRLRSQLLIL